MENNNTELRTLVIDRNEWNRGNSSFLYDSNSGLKCCLGFECLSLGVAKEDIQDKGSPFTIRNYYSKYQNIINHLIDYNRYHEVVSNSFVEYAIDLNDTPINLKYKNNNNNIFLNSEEHREQLLTEHFLTIGVKLEFIN